MDKVEQGIALLKEMSVSRAHKRRKLNNFTLLMFEFLKNFKLNYQYLYIYDHNNKYNWTSLRFFLYSYYYNNHFKKILEYI